LTNDEIEALLVKIIRRADVVLTTPAGARDGIYAEMNAKAKAVAIDEAGCMSKAELLSVWGNIMRVLVLAGDALQPRPAVMEQLNRFKLDARMSALAFFQASGFPVYRLWRQLRMCTDMFGAAKTLVYKDLDKFQYGPLCDPQGSSHAIGRAFEDWLVNVRRFPGLRPSRDGTLEPVWMHTPNTFATQVGTSRLNRTQILLTLRILSDFVDHAEVDAFNIVIIMPYKANVEWGNRQLASFPTLANMRPIQTADSFQGCQGDMAVVVFGTTAWSGPGFTSDENRLNVMITRQKSALLLVGDMGATARAGQRKMPKRGCVLSVEMVSPSSPRPRCCGSYWSGCTAPAAVSRSRVRRRRWLRNRRL
jgi:hypothetical protein